MPKEQIPNPDGNFTVGMAIGAVAPNGQQLLAKVTEVSEDTVTLDLNHRLAGERLTFDIKVVSIAE